MRYRFGWHKSILHMVLNPMKDKLQLTGVALFPMSPLSWLLTLLFAPRVRITQSVFNQVPLKSVSWLRDRKASDFAQDQQRNPTHPVATQLVTEQKTVSTLLGQVRKDRPTVSYSNSTFVQLWWSVRKPHPYKWHLCKVSLWQMLHDQSVALGILTAQRKCI